MKALFSYPYLKFANVIHVLINKELTPTYFFAYLEMRRVTRQQAQQENVPAVDQGQAAQQADVQRGCVL